VLGVSLLALIPPGDPRHRQGKSDMHHDTALIALVAMGLVLASIFGYLATRVRLPPIAGYLVAGVAMGPFTPGFVGDAGWRSGSWPSGWRDTLYRK
jgi:hypothetical protein